MPINFKYLLPSVLAVAVAQGAIAEETDSSPWSGDAELGAIWTSGNTKTNSLNGRFGIKHETETWVSEMKLSALGSQERTAGETDKRTTKEKYSGQLQFDRNLSEHSYLALSAQQDRDRFSGFYYQGSAGVGLGYRAIKQENMQLDLEAGPGYYREHTRPSDTAQGEVNEFAIVRLALKYDWTIREGVSFTEEVNAELGSDNSIYRSETGLKTQLNRSLATKLTYNVKYVEEVPEGKKKMDTEFGVTLVYSF